MAYSFNGTNQALSVASAPATAAPLTLFLMLNPSSLATSVPMSLRATATADRFEIDIGGASFPQTARFRAQSSSPAVQGQPQITSVIAQNVWYAHTGVAESSTSRYVFYNGTKSTQNTISVTPATLTTLSIGARSTISALFSGLVAEAAVWNAVLTDAEVTSLARGFKPFRIRPQSLQFYAPIVRNLQDLRGSRAITNNNSATVADHPRVY